MSTQSAPDVVCIGLAVCDILFKPVSKDILTQDSQIVEDMELQVGGDALNAAVNLTRLGNSTVLIGAVGADPMGEILLGKLKEIPIETNNIKIKNGCGTSTSAVLIEKSGERHIAHYSGANSSLCLDDIPNKIIENTKIMVIGSAGSLPALDGDPLCKLLRHAQAAGTQTVLDTAGLTDSYEREKIKSLFKYTDIFIPNIQEACILSGLGKPERAITAEQLKTIAHCFIELGVKQVIIKLGANGSFYQSETESFLCDSFKTDVKDTTGAGDAFVAGYITGLLRGLPPKKCCETANACGSLCISQTGTTGGIASFDQVQNYISAQQNRRTICQ